MKILTIGPGESTQWLFNLPNLNIPEDITILGMHRVFPYINVKLDYWTWGDPDAALEGLKVYDGEDIKTLPRIILPSYFETIKLFNINAGTSPINKDGRREKIQFYNQSVKRLKSVGKLDLIPNSYNTKKLVKDHEVFNHEQLRFNSENNYFGTVPFDGMRSEDQWARENKFTSLILPICHYLNATEVYCVGFDNRGTGIKRTIPQSHNDVSIIQDYLSKYPKWVDTWRKYHNMDIYSISPDNFTPNNSVMEYKSITELKWIK